MEQHIPPAGVPVRIAWTDGVFRLELHGRPAGLWLQVFENGVLVFEEVAPTAAAGARRAREVVAAIRRGEGPGYERGSA